MKKKMKKVLVILLAITLLTGGIFGVRTFANKLPSYKKSISKLFSRFYGDGSDTNTTVLRSDGMVHYSDSTSGDATEYWESNLFYTENSTSDTYNAYCIFPRGTSAGRKNQSVTGQNVTDVEAFQYIKKMLYYGYGGPGWNTTINANPDTNGFKYFYNEVCGVTYFKPDPNQPSSCETDNGESYYLITHLMLSSIAHYSNIPSAYGSQPEFSDIFYGTHVSMQTWLGARSQEFTMSGKIHSTNTPDVNDPDFKVWYIKGTATPDSFGIQNILYWTDTEEVPSTYCTKAKKVDSEGHEISGATFGLYSDSSCNNLVTSKSGSSVTFDGLEDDGPYFIEETIAPDGYSRNRGCYQADVVEENGSSCSADPVEIENGPLYLSFYKENENGDPFTSASFKVKNASGTYITVSARNSNYNNCYVYTGTSSEGTTMNPDSNGRICIVKIPDGTYSAHEQSTGNEGYYFENGTISNLRPGTDVRGKEDANSLKNKPFVLNFYKETENSAKVDGAKFEITYNNSKIGYSGTENYTDTNGATKKCYIYSSASDSTKTFISGENGNVGEVCIVRIPGNKDYTIKETDPVKYHTFGSSNSKTFSPSKYYAAKISGNTFVNYPTEFEFTKNVGRTKGKGISVEGSETITVNGQSVTLDSLTLSELKNLVFNITASGSSTNLSFIKTGDGVYEYAQDPNMDRPNGEITTNLKVGSNKKIKVLHLPEGTYEIKENNGGTCESVTDYTKCIGYYDQNTVQRFTITDCSSSRATSCTTYSTATATMTNIPTEITFTKSDLYSYVDAEDTVKFENEEELRAFDDIVFKLFTYDENNNKVYLTLKHIGNSGVCTNENSYSIYRYVAGDNSDGAGGTELHTCGGHIVITNLCRGKKYYIEEVSVPGYSVFTLPENESDRIKEYSIPCTEGEADQSTTTTAIINDTPTRVIFQKRDSKYGYLIPDETTTFKVYRCMENTECHPSENDSNAVLVKFSARGTITGDNEDSGKQVYKFLTTTDEQGGQSGVTELHPYRGELILRYLPGGFTYVLLETVPPKNYTLPRGRNAETRFTVSTSTVDVDEVDVPNKPTSLLLKKYSDDGELLEGAEFEIYEGTTCDPNLSPMAQPKELLSFKTITDGIYEYRRNFDTSRIRTCTDTVDGKCSGMTSTLTFEDYVDTWANFENSVNQREEEVEIKAGEALIQYLEYGHCYIIKEVKAPKGYSLPEKEADRYIMVRIEKEDDVVDTYKELINKPTPYTFYKFDEYNELIDGAEFKLQKLNSDKVYEDVTVTKEQDGNDRTFYKVDARSTNKVITTKKGTATIYFLEEGQYRIVETKAPAGKELPAKQMNVATFLVDKDGRVTGSSIITNKPKTEKIEVKPKAEAELIVNISTGQQVIRYGLIIGVIVLAIAGLLIVQNKSKKKDK